MGDGLRQKGSIGKRRRGGEGERGSIGKRRRGGEGVMKDVKILGSGLDS